LWDCSLKEISTRNTRKRENHMAEVIGVRPELLGAGCTNRLQSWWRAIILRCGSGKVAIIDGKERDGKKYYLRSI
jgi:hypothetical protein